MTLALFLPVDLPTPAYQWDHLLRYSPILDQKNLAPTKSAMPDLVVKEKIPVIIHNGR